MTGYFASHFFNDAVYRWTEDFARYIEQQTGISLYVPQRNDAINNKKGRDETITDIEIAKQDLKWLQKSNILIASLDGLTIDDGVAGEIMAFATMKDYEQKYHIADARPRLLIGVITDMRWHGTGEYKLYRNQMVTGVVRSLGHLVEGYAGMDDYREETVKWIRQFLACHSKE